MLVSALGSQDAPLDRALVAEALAATWTRLDPTDAAARARRVAAYLEDGLRDSKTTANESVGLVLALSAVYNRLDPAERSGRANAVADILVATLRKPTNTVAAYRLSDALAKMCAYLDRSAVPCEPATPCSPFWTILPSYPAAAGLILETHLDLPVVYEPLFKAVSARVEERDLKRLLAHPLAAGRFQPHLPGRFGRSEETLLPQHLGLPRYYRVEWKSNRRGGTGNEPVSSAAPAAKMKPRWEMADVRQCSPDEGRLR